MGAKERFGGQESATGHWDPADDGWSVVVCVYCTYVKGRTGKRQFGTQDVMRCRSLHANSAREGAAISKGGRFLLSNHRPKRPSIPAALGPEGPASARTRTGPATACSAAQ